MQPSCQSCNKVKQPCSYERSPRPQYPGGKARLVACTCPNYQFTLADSDPRSYIGVLEERIALLEARLPDHAEDHFDHFNEREHQSTHNQLPVNTASLNTHHGLQHEPDTRSPTKHVDVDVDDDDEQNSLVDGVAYLSLCASGTTNANQEPFYVGSSSGATIARVLQSSIYKRPLRRASTWSASNDVGTVSTPPDTSDYQSPADLGATAVPFPGRAQSRMLFDFFFETIHPRWPLLDRVRYETVFEKQNTPGALSVTEYSILHLIYTITARFLAVTRKPCGIDDEVRHKPSIRLR